jgi:hypothetical protein
MRFSVRDAAREGAAWIARTPQVWSTALLALAIVLFVKAFDETYA